MRWITAILIIVIFLFPLFFHALDDAMEKVILPPPHEEREDLGQDPTPYEGKSSEFYVNSISLSKTFKYILPY